MSSRKSRIPSSSKNRSRSSSGRKSSRSSSSSKRTRTLGQKSGRSSSRKKGRTPSGGKPRRSGQGNRRLGNRKSRSPSPGNTRSLSNRKSRTPRKSGIQRTSGRRHGSSTSSGEPRGSTERVSKSALCNLKFPVARVKSMLKVHNHGLRVSDKAAVFTTAVLEYLTAEILEMSINAARGEGLSRIKTRHVNKAVKMDADFFHNFKNSSIPNSNFIPLSEMIEITTLPFPREPIQSLSGLSTATATSPASSTRSKTGAKSATRREG